jgi:hypothetical protein
MAYCRDVEDYSTCLRERCDLDEGADIEQSNQNWVTGTIAVASNFNVNLIRVNHGSRNLNGSHVFHPCRIGKAVLKKEQLDVL